MAKLLCGLTWTLPALPAQAQLGVPGLNLPQLPPVLEQPVGAATAKVGDELRRLRIRQLLESRGGTLETDPRGDVIVRGQVGALDPDGNALARAMQAGFSILRDSELTGLQLRMVVLRAPAGMSTRRALRKLRQLDPQGTYDYNHVYFESGSAMPLPASGPAATAAPPAAAAGSQPLRVGMVDAGIDDAHPSLQGVRIRHFGCDGRVVPADHGTAVASILAGHDAADAVTAPAMELYAADAFCGEDAGGSIGLMALGLDWLARESVPVVNISMVGPPSLLLTGLVRAMLRRGHLLVAAVGNDGPAAPPLYPAAYAGVVGVTGVDARSQVLPEACRGEQVDFAARGAGMRAAGVHGAWSEVRGTSYASPIVARLLAADLQQLDPDAAQRAIDSLAAGAVDLGRAGPDPVYGRGLVGVGVALAQLDSDK